MGPSSEREMQAIVVRAAIVAAAVFAIASAGLLAFWQDIPPDWRIIRENGPVESATAILWGLVAIGCLVGARRAGPGRVDWALAALVVLFLLARELDFQKRFTDWNLNTLRNYVDEDIPLGERLRALAAYWLPPAISSLVLFGRWAEPFFKALRKRQPYSLAALGWLALVGATAVLDKAHHWIHLPPQHSHVFHVFEEVLEMVLALFPLAIVAGLLKARSSPDGGAE